MFKRSFSLWRGTGISSKSQIIGEEIPVFEPYPFDAVAILRLYRGFWRLVYQYPPSERNVMAFKLRNAFRSRRDAVGRHHIQRLLQRGATVYNAHKEKLEKMTV